jgi:molybdenum cofactor biosynthesis enzyme
LNHANLAGTTAFKNTYLTIPKCIFGITVKKCQTNMENFGISLSVWDYIKYIPKDGRDIELGFNDENEFPHDFIKQVLSLKK